MSVVIGTKFNMKLYIKMSMAILKCKMAAGYHVSRNPYGSI